MAIDALDVAALALLLSPERLGSLTELTGSIEKAIELHQETLQLGAALMNVTATVEIALRNSVCENLSRHFSVPNWLIQPPVPFQWRLPEQGKITTALDSARRAEYSKLTQAQKGALDALAYTKGRPPNTFAPETCERSKTTHHINRGKGNRRTDSVFLETPLWT